MNEDQQVSLDAHWAQDYDSKLHQGLRFTGESKDYFAKKRVEWTSQHLEKIDLCVESLVDFGCGIGSTMRWHRHYFADAQLIGLDTSSAAIDAACRTNAGRGVRFETLQSFEPDGTADLVYCNGVFHHIDPSQRDDALSVISACLRPGGVFALWENNPWNPGTRLVMSRIEFDKDAKTLSPLQGASMLKRAGFSVERVSHHFFFPSFLAALRGLEKQLRRVPLGGQYLVLAQRR